MSLLGLHTFHKEAVLIRKMKATVVCLKALKTSFLTVSYGLLFMNSHFFLLKSEQFRDLKRVGALLETGDVTYTTAMHQLGFSDILVEIG